MSHLTLYRKYRSQTFGDLVGQGHIVRSLQNALSGNKHVQAYLFTGPRGTGKTSTARLLAKALNCHNGPIAEPCNVCEECVSISQGACFDVIELDAASEAGVEEVREKIVEVAEYKPSFCRFRVIILDEVHDLSGKAFDALLKTIEEPPAHLIFILATTEFQKVPPTIRSRCQKFEFHRGSIQDISARLKHVADAEGIDVEPQAISTLARMADGGFRDALNLLEQASLMADGTITVGQIYEQIGLIEDAVIDRVLVAMAEGDTKALLTDLDLIASRGNHPRSIVESMMYRLSDLTRAALGESVESDGAMAAALRESATRIGLTRILDFRNRMAKTLVGINEVSLPRIWLESELIGFGKEPATQPATLIAKPNATAEPPLVTAAPTTPPNRAAVHPAATNGQSADKEPLPAASKVREPLQEPTGDAQLDHAIHVWKATVRAMFAPPGSPNLANKLCSTRVKSFDGENLVVAFERNIEFNSVVGGELAAKKTAMIAGKLAESGGEGWRLEYVVEPNGGGSIEIPTAVELPVDGKRLHELAKEELLGPPSEEKNQHETT